MTRVFVVAILVALSVVSIPSLFAGEAQAATFALNRDDCDVGGGGIFCALEAKSQQQADQQEQLK